jgi:cyclophilin family peptidyl-prolyl cis-trans isomerase
VAGLVYLFNQQQIISNLPTPTLTPWPTWTPNATATAAAMETATARANATPTPETTPESPATPAPTPVARARPTYTAPPPMTIDTSKIYTATIETVRGPIVIELYPQDAPITVNNFVTLARDGFYDGLTFHRVEPWVIQGGDPEGTGRGGPGYRFEDEPVRGEYLRGIVAMANAGPNTNGSQFFILKRDTPLPKQYNLFGKVVSGMEVVDQIQVGDRMTSVTITER